ncbi:MAG TPA: (2Fe-2S)-binding protein [Syntrophorhabdaceae bacterium]|nr:(2Fe-2S)-binding protein [Syntrophorhabdaceae bacterium]
MDEEEKKTDGEKGLTRRQFIKSVGTAAAVTAVSGRIAAAAEEKEDTLLPADKLAKITLTINGRRHRLVVEPRWSLLYVLRERLGLTGTKVGCERGECGACTVLIDGIPKYACMTLAVEAEGTSITTLEGLMNGDELGAVQQAFLEEDAFQCGYCTPGQVMAAEGLLRAKPHPTFDEIRKGMSGNLCRCGSYAHIFRAVAKAADLKAKGKE